MINQNRSGRGRKNGFTLVELLAVIVILAVILVIAVPKIMLVIEDAKKATLESSAKMVASEAEKKKVQNQVLGKDENITCENVSRLNDIDYENCYIEFLNNQAYVTIIGSNKFEDMYICKGTKNESKVVDRCPNERVSVTIDPSDGSVTDLSGIYKEGDIIELENPSKENATFINWNVVKGNSTLFDNKLTVGSEDTIVWAEYEEWGELIIDLDGGSVSNNQSGKYKSNTTIELETPIKENYKFVEWEKIEGNGIVSGTTFTMGSLNTKIKAKWEPITYTISYTLDGGSANNFTNYTVETNTFTLENPTKEGYEFIGWTGSNGDIPEISLTILKGSLGNKTYTANWKIKVAFAIYSEDDTSLTFYKRGIIPQVDDIYEGKKVTAIYTGFETDIYEAGGASQDWLPTTPWASYASSITSVVFKDTIKPESSLDHWFSRFRNCSYFDVAKLDTSSVTSMYDTFASAASLTTSAVQVIGLNEWNTSNVTNMYATFFSFGNVETSLDLSNWNTSNVSDMRALFQGIGVNSINISGWDTSKVTNMTYMFYCPNSSANLKTIYVSEHWSTKAVTEHSDMFYNCINIVGGSGTTYNSKYIDKTYARIDGGTSSPGYFTRKQ